MLAELQRLLEVVPDAAQRADYRQAVVLRYELETFVCDGEYAKALRKKC